ncbi:MAG: hypothetical protein AAF773_05155 [Cyanobacteria bacterium P01_D01_bin.115]
MIDTTRDISDLLPNLKAAALKLRRQPNEVNGKALDKVIQQVARRWGFVVRTNRNASWNQVIDTLDARYSNWRGYIPEVKRDKRGAA